MKKIDQVTTTPEAIACHMVKAITAITQGLTQKRPSVKTMDEFRANIVKDINSGCLDVSIKEYNELKYIFKMAEGEENSQSIKN